MGLFIAVIAFIFVVSLSCARVYRRRRSFVRHQQAHVIVGSDPSTGTTVVANTNVQVSGGSDQNGLFLSDEGKEALSPFCKYSIIDFPLTYNGISVNPLKSHFDQIPQN